MCGSYGFNARIIINTEPFEYGGNIIDNVVIYFPEYGKLYKESFIVQGNTLFYDALKNYNNSDAKHHTFQDWINALGYKDATLIIEHPNNIGLEFQV